MERRTTDEGNAYTGEVHAHLGTHPDKGEGMSGKFDTEGGDLREQADGMMGEARDRADDLMGEARGRADEMVGQARNRIEGMTDQVRSRADGMTNRVRDQVEDLRGRAGGMMSSARERAGGMLDDAEERIEQRTGLITMVRENPLPALALAFAAGYLLAGSDDQPSRRRGMAGRARSQLRSAIVGGISAALAQEMRGMMESQGGAGGMLGSLFGGSQGHEDTGSAQRRDQQRPQPNTF